MKVINFKDFMKRDFQPENKVISHVKRNKEGYLTVAGVMFLVIGLPDTSFASTGIDQKARDLYFGKLLVFGKWAIILKGGWDTINKALKEDFEGAKKVFFSYLIIYAILQALPWGLDLVEDVFS